MEKILQDFGVKPLLLAAQIVNFLVLLFILKKVLYKPILKVLEERKNTIAQSLKNAEEIEKKLAQTEVEREEALEKAAKEAQKILEDATKSANQIINEAHTKAASGIEEMLKKGRDQIKQDREVMQQELKGEVADIVVSSLQKITGKVLTSKDQKKLVEDSVKGLKQ